VLAVLPLLEFVDRHANIGHSPIGMNSQAVIAADFTLDELARRGVGDRLAIAVTVTVTVTVAIAVAIAVAVAVTGTLVAVGLGPGGHGGLTELVVGCVRFAGRVERSRQGERGHQPVIDSSGYVHGAA